jgi:hypothetical protein
MKVMEKVNSDSVKGFQQVLDAIEKDIKCLIEEENYIVALKGKVLKEILDKINTTVERISEGKKL